MRLSRICSGPGITKKTRVMVKNLTAIITYLLFADFADVFRMIVDKMLGEALTILEYARASLAASQQVLLQTRSAVLLVLLQKCLLVETFEALWALEFAVVYRWRVVGYDVRVEVARRVDLLRQRLVI